MNSALITVIFVAHQICVFNEDGVGNWFSQSKRRTAIDFGGILNRVAASSTFAWRIVLQRGAPSALSGRDRRTKKNTPSSISWFDPLRGVESGRYLLSLLIV